MRFFDYDYNAQEIIEYERLGECNHCGDCCTTRIEFYGIGHKGRGVWACVTEPGREDFFQQVARVGETGAEVCPYYQGERCSIHATKVRMCKVWPMNPAQLALFPRCSYTFREIERRPMAFDKGV